MKNKPLFSGIIAAAFPIPMLIFTILWDWIFVFVIGFGLLQYDDVPGWLETVALLPLTISPLLGVAGIVHGIAMIKEKLSYLGIILSAVCLVENFVLIFGIYYLGSKF